jgi:hypothetical protein
MGPAAGAPTVSLAAGLHRWQIETNKLMREEARPLAMPLLH